MLNIDNFFAGSKQKRQQLTLGHPLLAMQKTYANHGSTTIYPA
jgi:hypothetical protein